MATPPRSAILALSALIGCSGCRDERQMAVPCPPAPSISASVDRPPEVWPFSASSTEQLRSFGFFHPGVEWKDLTWQGMKLAVATETLPTDGESYIDVHGYVFNQHFQEWRRFVSAQIRGAGVLELRLDPASGMLTVVGAADNDKKDKSLLSFDLHAVHDDR